MAETGQTIIIKKIKKGGHGHHGGAWKVAYADFVTAMMAFFLLMWLLNATEAESLSGLADYFAPTVGIKDNMGIGFRGGKSALSKGVGADKNTNKGIIFGGTPAGPIVKVTEKIEMETDEPENEKVMLLIGKAGTTEFQGTEDSNPTEATPENPATASNFEELAQSLETYINDVTKEAGVEQTVAIVQTPEGLELQIRDTSGNAMFKGSTAEMEPNVEKALAQLASVLSQLPNYLSITGHTSSVPVRGQKGYGNWELSTDRANAARRYLIQSGIQPEQIERVIGKSDNEPLDPKHPAAPVNNRISIILLRDAALPEHKLGAPQGVFIDPHSSDARELTDEETKKDSPEQKEESETFHDNSQIQEVIDTVTEQSDNEKVQEIIQEPAPKPPLVPNAPTRAESAAQAFESVVDATEEKTEESQYNAVNKHLLEPDPDEAIVPNELQELRVGDPFASGKTINPLTVKNTEDNTKVKSTPAPVNSYLLEEDNDEETIENQYEDLRVQDPFANGNSQNPLAISP